MFEKTANITKIHSVLKLEWDKRCLPAMDRPYHALSLRLEGETDFYHGEETYTTHTNDIIFMPRGYDYIQDAKVHEKIICIHFDTAERVPQVPEVFTPHNASLFHKYFTALYQIWNEKQTGYEYAALSVLNRIFETIMVEKAKERSRGAQNFIEPFITYINVNFTSPDLSVSELARMAHVSEVYFRKVFGRVMNMSPYAYIMKLRLDYAQDLLSSGYYTVEETAVRCGIPNPKSFATFLKKKTGLTPSMIRRHRQ